MSESHSCSQLIFFPLDDLTVVHLDKNKDQGWNEWTGMWTLSWVGDDLPFAVIHALLSMISPSQHWWWHTCYRQLPCNLFNCFQGHLQALQMLMIDGGERLDCYCSALKGHAHFVGQGRFRLQVKSVDFWSTFGVVLLLLQWTTLLTLPCHGNRAITAMEHSRQVQISCLYHLSSQNENGKHMAQIRKVRGILFSLVCYQDIGKGKKYWMKQLFSRRCIFTNYFKLKLSGFLALGTHNMTQQRGHLFICIIANDSKNAYDKWNSRSSKRKNWKIKRYLCTATTFDLNSAKTF